MGRIWAVIFGAAVSASANGPYAAVRFRRGSSRIIIQRISIRATYEYTIRVVRVHPVATDAYSSSSYVHDAADGPWSTVASGM
eukprot:6191099-Pleurochrysis_carterae.AAC.1